MPKTRLAPSAAITAFAVLGLLSTTGCSKPTEEQCEQFADHFVTLLEESRENPSSKIQKLANNQRDKLIDGCVQDGSVEEVECVLAQSSMVDVEANCK